MTPRIEQLIREIEALGEVFEWAGPASETAVGELERALCTALPPSYRAFLLKYGAGGIRAQIGISGIYDDDPLSLNLGTTYGDTIRAREQYGIPAHLIVIERGDEHFPPMCLDTSKPGTEGEYPVVGFWVISRNVSTDSYANFAEYVEVELATSLEVIREESE
jgi:antitoxin YobK